MPTKFTIAVATHNRRETALLAVRSALAQVRPPEQVIVLCDGCTDGTSQMIRSLGDERLEVIELTKLPGFAYAHRNRALAMARGEVITWLADDDLLLPDHLERIGEYWDSGTVELVSAAAIAVGKDDAMTWCGLDLSIAANREIMEAQNTNVMSAFSVPVKLVLEAGGWDGAQPRWGDWDLWKRILHAGARPAMTSEPTVLHFMATGREQAWSLRVRQNTDWSRRMSSPAELAQVRRELRRVRSQREAWLVAHAEECRRSASAGEAQVVELRAALSNLHATTAPAKEAASDLVLGHSDESLRRGLLRLLRREGERLRARGPR